MKERPILMAGDLVVETMAGRKTQTRRPVKDAAGAFWDHGGYRPFVAQGAVAWEMADGSPVPPALPVPRTVCPFGAPGDRLWVRETWQLFDPDEDGALVAGRLGRRAPFSGGEGEREIRWTACYRADGELTHPTDGPARWRPSIHMPRWASRLTLDVLSVRVERVQDITESDAKAEGFTARPHAILAETVGSSARDEFLDAWSRIYRAPPFSVACNPWVWVIDYRVAEKNS